MTDHYTDGTCRWWQLSRPSPELVAALDHGWLLRASLRWPAPCWPAPRWPVPR